jgi:enamine deaminase RidA (YjgF/YER057c/UK114 family)
MDTILLRIRAVGGTRGTGALNLRFDASTGLAHDTAPSLIGESEEDPMSDDAYAIRLDPDPYAQFYISQGFRVGNLVFLSGQVPITDDGMTIDGDFDVQAEATLRNMKRALAAGGSSLENVIKVTIYLTNMKAHRSRVMELRQKWFRPPYPADTLVEVTALGDPSRLIEIDAIALVGGVLVG